MGSFYQLDIINPIVRHFTSGRLYQKNNGRSLNLGPAMFEKLFAFFRAGDYH